MAYLALDKIMFIFIVKSYFYILEKLIVKGHVIINCQLCSIVIH